MKSALQYIYSKHWPPDSLFILETNCNRVADHIKGNCGVPLFCVVNIIKDIHYMLDNMNFCYVITTQHEANQATNWLAKTTRITQSCKSWTSAWPTGLACILSSDVRGIF